MAFAAEVIMSSAGAGDFFFDHHFLRLVCHPTAFVVIAEALP